MRGQLLANARTLTKLFSSATRYRNHKATIYSVTKAAHVTSGTQEKSCRYFSTRFNENITSTSLCGDSQESYDEHPFVCMLDNVSRGRKQKWVNREDDNRAVLLIKKYTKRRGTVAAMELFMSPYKMTVEELTAIIECCIEMARDASDKDDALKDFHMAYMVFEVMRNCGFDIAEETYGPFLKFIIDMRMVKVFYFFRDKIKKENPKLLSKLAYYEMLLWIKVGDKDKMRMLIVGTHGSDDSELKESYLVALCEGDRREEALMLLETLDIKKISSEERMERIFKSLGRLLLELHAKKFILELKTDDTDNNRQHLSNLIYSYATSMPNIQIEGVIVKLKTMQAELKVASSTELLEKLIETCCNSLEVRLALDLVDSMFEDRLSVNIDTINSLLAACYESSDYILVHRIKYLMKGYHYTIWSSSKTFKIMLNLCLKMDDYDRAYSMIKDLREWNMLRFFPLANPYNDIMLGFLRQKDFDRALMVLKEMDAANVKPNYQTYSYIKRYCNTDEDILKYHRKWHQLNGTYSWRDCVMFKDTKLVQTDKAAFSKCTTV